MSAFSDWADKLQPRERRLLGALGGIAAVMLLALVPFGVSLLLDGRRAEVKELGDAIAAIKAGRDNVRARQAKRDAIVARYANRAPAIAGLLEKVAREHHLEIPDSQDHPDTPHGKRYVERSSMVHFRKAPMLAIAKTLEEIEQLHMPVSISRLSIRKRGGEADSYDVELGVSAYDRSESAAAPAASGKPASSAPGAPPAPPAPAPPAPAPSGGAP